MIKEVQLRAEQTGNAIPDFGPIKSSEEAEVYIRHFWKDDIQIFESFFILLLNRANQPIAWAKVSQGGVAGTVVDIKIICKYAIDVLASSVICAHNHPSGTLRPSDADHTLTKTLKKALDTLGIQLLDHLILTKTDYYSMADKEEI